VRQPTEDVVWHVRHTHSTTERMLWHRVANMSSTFKGGKLNRANTVCGLVYDFPTANVIFTDFNGRGTLATPPPAHLKCQKGCYS